MATAVKASVLLKLFWLLIIFGCLSLFVLFVRIHNLQLSENSLSLPPTSGSRKKPHVTPTIYPFTDLSGTVNQTGLNFWNTIQPGFNCPSGLLKEIGPFVERKATCGLINLRDNPSCLVYSFGVGWDTAFEEVLVSRTKCQVYGYDHTINKIRHFDKRFIFRQLGIGEEDKDDVKTLKSLMKMNGHLKMDLLKMDVEGAEYRSLDKILADFKGDLPFGQLLVELHVWEWHGNWNKTESKKKADMVRKFLRKLEEQGNLRLFSKKVNPFDGGNCCCEMSFINMKQWAMERFMPENDEKGGWKMFRKMFNFLAN